MSKTRSTKIRPSRSELSLKIVAVIVTTISMSC